jgi:predicted RNA-binding protein with PUA-like domain
MKYWLIKSEPSTFSIDNMKQSQIEPWNGVRNYQARNFMKEMRLGDICFFYHSNNKNPGIVGLVRIVKEFYEDPDDNRFVCVDVEYIKHTNLLSLQYLKSIPEISHLPLFNQSRLSVQPVDLEAAKLLLGMI